MLVETLVAELPVEALDAAVLDGLAGSSALDIFGSTDAIKLRSSLTLFAQAAGPGSVYERLLDKYFDGERDELTLGMLQLQAGT